MASRRRRTRQGDPDESDSELKLQLAEKEIVLLREELKKLKRKTPTPGNELGQLDTSLEIPGTTTTPVTSQSQPLTADGASGGSTDCIIMANQPQAVQANQPQAVQTNQPQANQVAPQQPQIIQPAIPQPQANQMPMMNNHRYRDFRAPSPRQMEFDGKRPWGTFIKPFRELANACNWAGEERRFRLLNSLRDEAAEYVYSVLHQDIIDDLDQLERALEDRFGEKRSPNAYLAALEQRKLGVKESLAEYGSDVKRLVLKGYPTADVITRESIGLRHFIKGLGDQQMTIAVGMRSPTTIEDATEALETYLTLRDEVGKPQTRIRAIQHVTFEETKAETNAKTSTDKHATESYITEKQFQELLATLDKRFSGISKLVKESKSGYRTNPGGSREARNFKRDFRCYICEEEGHIARSCPNKENVDPNKNGIPSEN